MAYNDPYAKANPAHNYPGQPQYPGQATLTYPPAARSYPPSQPYPAAAGYAPSPSTSGGYKPQNDNAYDVEKGMGGVPDGSYSAAPGSYASFMEKSVRMGFIRKVYSILTVQLLVTFGITFLFVLNDNVKTWIKEHPGFLYGAIGVQLFTIIALACCGDMRRRYPANYILLGMFTLAESYLVGAVSSYYDTNAVLIAFGITMGVTVALTLFACQTRLDFTTCGAGLFAVLMAFMIMGFIMIPFRDSRSNVLNCVYAGIGAAIFAVFLVYDTQLIVGGNHRYQCSPDEYVFAALNLYIDIIQMFMYILRILGSSRK